MSRFLHDFRLSYKSNINAFVPIQEAWLEDIERILSKMPEDLGNPGDDAARQLCLIELRRCIATRWAFIQDLREKVPKAHFDVLVSKMKESLSNLVEIHGTSLPFCPSPPDSLLETKAGVKSEPSVLDESTTASSGRSKVPDMVPHTFKFLQLHGKSAEVWTRVQAYRVGNNIPRFKPHK